MIEYSRYASTSMHPANVADENKRRRLRGRISDFGLRVVMGV